MKTRFGGFFVLRILVYNPQASLNNWHLLRQQRNRWRTIPNITILIPTLPAGTGGVLMHSNMTGTSMTPALKNRPNG